MTEHQKKAFSSKHGSDIRPDAAVMEEIKSRAKDGQLACAVAFDIAKKLNVTAAVVGRNADLLNFKLFKCQLGLFGYPDGKTVSPLGHVSAELADAIRGAVENGYLPCKNAWEIARRFELPKRTVADACESLKLKIRPCQLGAF